MIGRMEKAALRRMIDTAMMLALAAWILAACSGCRAWEALEDTETAEFVAWLEQEAPAAGEIAVRDGTVILTRHDGSVEVRELPGSVLPSNGDTGENPGAVFGDKALEAIRKSIETGSPWPGIIGIAEAAALALVGGYAARKRKAHLEAAELAEVRTEQVDAMILGVRDADVPGREKSAARRAVAERISALAKIAGVEHGPNGLKA
ncbi:MAG: hypothetical protein HQ592_01945, partial [Planctomycetes bacterium]|nr:hypothetical protein [Planctomycetota bacterium]